ncbi:MAG: hypothetical protein CFH22_01517 [Alphaproteobacteria bacterium MarineAlpha5_Bin12]|nr:MAG: hypothetical protein CFH22_01517 [Alphaproteobacteria bacterium MarineAlpha5_Bin12]|tara:strand:- start:2979 stop:3659 length:681 start_codon:yes stop_codon:yes gene_type:complete
MSLIIEQNVIRYEKLYKDGHDHKYPNLDLIRLESIFLKKNKGKLLDYGFGASENTIHLAKRGYEIYGLETSNEAVKICKRKLQENGFNKFKKNISLLQKNEEKLPYLNNSFDNIICISVLSLLQTKENIIQLINEFYRILKKNGKMIIDINGPSGDFAKKGKYISEDEFEYSLKKDNQNKLKVYCPKNQLIFKKLFDKFIVKEIGNIQFNYFDISNNEYIACLEKK